MNLLEKLNGVFLSFNISRVVIQTAVKKSYLPIPCNLCKRCRKAFVCLRYELFCKFLQYALRYIKENRLSLILPAIGLATNLAWDSSCPLQKWDTRKDCAPVNRISPGLLDGLHWMSCDTHSWSCTISYNCFLSLKVDENNFLAWKHAHLDLIIYRWWNKSRDWHYFYQKSDDCWAVSGEFKYS